MTKTIDTLIQDIYDTLEKGISVDTPEMRDALEDFSKDIMYAASDALQEGERSGEARFPPFPAASDLSQPQPSCCREQLLCL